MKVKDAMHTGAICVEPNTSIRDIAKRMRDSDVGAIPIKADGQLVGIVTDRDITCRVLANSGDAANMTAQDVMTKDIVCCSPEDDVESAIEAMEAKQIRRLPVTDSHKAIIGMLSLGDVSHKVSAKLSGEVLRAVSGHHIWRRRPFRLIACLSSSDVLNSAWRTSCAAPKRCGCGMGPMSPRTPIESSHQANTGVCATTVVTTYSIRCWSLLRVRRPFGISRPRWAPAAALLEWLSASSRIAHHGIDRTRHLRMSQQDRGSSQGTLPVLMGHSLGGMFAAIYSASAPESLCGLVLLGTLMFPAGTSKFRDALVSWSHPFAYNTSASWSDATRTPRYGRQSSRGSCFVAALSGQTGRLHAAEVRLWPPLSQRLSVHDVMDGLGDICRVIADSLDVLGAKKQMCAEWNLLRIVHHTGEKLAEHWIVQRVHFHVSSPYTQRTCNVVPSIAVKDIF